MGNVNQNPRYHFRNYRDRIIEAKKQKKAVFNSHSSEIVKSNKHEFKEINLNQRNKTDEHDFEIKIDEPILGQLSESELEAMVLEEMQLPPFNEQACIAPDDEVKETESHNINIRALSNHTKTYELETFEKKALLIFNQVEINGFTPRNGTEIDVKALKNTFNNLGFDVTEHKDLTKKEIEDALKTFFKKDFTDYGCIGVAVLSHGSTFGQLWAKDQQYSEMQIINCFSTHDKPTLVTKPKFLIIQACRGTRVNPGVPVFTKHINRSPYKPCFEPYHIPMEADLLILHSSFMKNPSYRDELEGSWFIQSLCNKIDELAATHDLEAIITAVKRDVAINKQLAKYDMVNTEMQFHKQMPVMTTTLIRKLYLKRFGDLSSDA